MPIIFATAWLATVRNRRCVLFVFPEPFEVKDEPGVPGVFVTV
jgi:hypothetical protein